MSSALSLLPPGRGGRASRVGGRPVGLGLPLSTGSRRREEARPRGPACCWMGGLAGGSGQNFLQMALRKAGGCERLLDTSSELPGGCGCAWGHAAARRAGLQLSALAAAMAAFRPPLQPGFPRSFPACSASPSVPPAGPARCSPSPPTSVLPTLVPPLRGDGSVTTVPPSRFPTFDPSQQVWAAPASNPGVIFIIE